MTFARIAPPARAIELTVDGRPVRVPEGATLLDACRAAGVDTPTLCFAAHLTPVNVCRVCVVELEGARTLVPSCSRRAEPGMVVLTASPRVEASRRMVVELLASSADTSAAPALEALVRRYGARPERMGPADPGAHVAQRAGHHRVPSGEGRATLAQPVKVDNELYVRDYQKCILCMKCVEACGDDAQSTYAIAVAGRGFDARIATEHDGALPDSACVYCGNCVAVCPTGALMPTTEHAMRREGTWDEARQTTTETVCGYCGVGCVVELHVQDERVVKVTSPASSSVTSGHLCVKGRFGFGLVNERGPRE